MDFKEMKQTILSLQREDYENFIKAIISIEKDTEDEELLDALYDYYIDVSDLCLINDEFDDAIYVYEEDDSEEPLCRKMLNRSYF
ncbi:hypothetical protein SAMN05421767_10423 [Granulicatella balaenopterae]|uniref:Uncharacterized protein n=1 Tax=Granulicatella balaenopterae TaxID=137733 RepID=A0A1H9I159_9LACT|nr:hypothetical protein [Granulicatella balaenopterae]SEQ68329.1 hypothetical protein SAMN05421767_10423 [Granulicatella balaenopterae]